MLNRTKLLHATLLFFYLLHFTACATDNKTERNNGQYEERVVIPKYNPNDPTHVLITPSNGKWNRYVLNDPNKKHFYVKPGKYANNNIGLTRSGTKNSRRTMSLYNGNNLHPAALPDNQVANVWFHFDGADYWTIDRMANLDRNVNPSLVFKNGATHNIVNRWHLRNFGYGVQIRENCHYNTVQNSYINHATEQSRRSRDAVALDIYVYNRGSVIGTKFVNNDIRNPTDGIQLTTMINGATNNADFAGTVIDSNRIWLDDTISTDVNGNLTPKGGYAYAENALGFKGASKDPKNPVIITNNIIWGYDRVDTKTKIPLAGLLSTHAPENVKMTDNIITDSMVGVRLGKNAQNWEFKRNVISNIHLKDPEDKPNLSMLLLTECSNNIIKENMFINNAANSQGSGWAIFMHKTSKNNTLQGNVFINTTRSGGVFRGHTFDNNWFYKAPDRLPSGQKHHFVTATAAKMGDYTFEYERFTKKPKRKTLKGIVTTKNSPHYGKAGYTIKKVYSTASIYNNRNYVNVALFMLL